MTALERFWAKVKKTEGGCWLWIASCGYNGYGQFFPVKGTRVYAHRFSYEIHKGEIPDNREVDHICNQRACVNPEHLRLLTHRENCRRGTAGQKCKERFQKITHCPHGHEYTPENTAWWKQGELKARRCKTCEGIRGRERRKHIKA